jgi:transcriptional regulator with XRE-family HTH domain
LIGSFVRDYRKNVGKTLAELSSASGLTRNQLHELEQGNATALWQGVHMPRAQFVDAGIVDFSPCRAAA